MAKRITSVSNERLRTDGRYPVLPVYSVASSSAKGMRDDTSDTG